MQRFHIIDFITIGRLAVASVAIFRTLGNAYYRFSRSFSNFFSLNSINLNFYFIPRMECANAYFNFVFGHSFLIMSNQFSDFVHVIVDYN